MLFCSLKDRPGSMGQYGVELSLRARKTLEKQSIQLFLKSRVDWVLDGLHVVIDAMLSDQVRVSDYLMFQYPEGVARRQTDTTGKRQTLRFRFRYLLRCLEKTSAHFAEFSTQDVAPLLTTMEIFVSIAKQICGTAATEKLELLRERFARLWSCDAPALDSEELLRDELSRLVDMEDVAFAELYQAMRAREMSEHEPDIGQTLNATNAMLGEVRNELGKATAVQRRSLRVFEQAMIGATDADGDPYSQMAGLEHLRGARREEVLTCIRYSHEKPFAIVREAKSGNGSLQALASVVWRANREQFEAYAKLAHEPGYKDARSLAAKLYKLAAKYPSADHFVWRA